MRKLGQSNDLLSENGWFWLFVMKWNIFSKYPAFFDIRSQKQKQKSKKAIINLFNFILPILSFDRRI